MLYTEQFGIMINSTKLFYYIKRGSGMNKIIAAIIVAAALILVGMTGYYLFRDTSKPGDGVYKVVDCEEYPDAYIKIESGKAQFFNIDLNARYKKDVVSRYITYLERYKKQKLTKEIKREISDAVDVNKMFCDTPFKLDYSEENYNSRDEEERHLYHYNFGFIVERYYLSYMYDSGEKTITLNQSEMIPITFRLE